MNWLVDRLLPWRRRERELQQELDSHFAMALQERLDRGEDPDQAELAVRREFGNRALIAETTRDMWGAGLLSSLVQDVRYALRGMRRSPGFTVVAVLSLALGIGANTAIFSLMERVMLRALPVDRPEELVELLQHYPGEPRGNGYWTQRSFEHYRDSNHVFSALTGTSIDNRVRILADGSAPEYVVGEHVLPDYFEMLGVRPAVGRAITAGDAGNAVISWDWWTSRLGQDPRVLGRKIIVQGAPATIIGVAPRAFTGLRAEARTAVWLLRPPDSPMGLALLARRKPGVSLSAAQAEMSVLYAFTIAERAAGSPDPLVRQLRVEVEPAGAGLATLRDRIGKPISVLMTIVGLLLLLACANLASLLLARGAGRQREMALRASVGASRWRLIRQVLAESLTLSALGTLAGVVVASTGTSLLLAILASGREHERVELQVAPNLSVLAFTTAIAVAAALVFGILPALTACGVSPLNALRQGGTAQETRSYRYLNRLLVGAQVALSMLLLSMAGLFIGNLRKLETTDLGFDRDRVLLVSLDAPRAAFTAEQLAVAYRRVMEQAALLPGVRSATLCAPTPLQGAGASAYAATDGFVERAEDRRRISIARVAPRYLETLGIPLLAGRDLTAADEAHPNVGLINQAMARKFFAGRNPIGRSLTLDHITLDPEPHTYEVLGVVGDAHYLEIREAVKPTIYLPAFHDGRLSAHSLVLRTAARPQSMIGELQRLLTSVNPDITAARVITLDAQIDASIVPERLIALLSGFFGLLGALLAGIGLYALLAYTVVRRTGEIGLRMALGARVGDVVWMVLREALVMLLGGIAAGIPLSIWGRAAALTVIQDLSATNVFAVTAGGLSILMVGLVAVYLPARWAAGIEPLVALRHD